MTALRLYPFQEEGVEFLAQPGPRLLADEMGLGKSVQAIRACDRIGAAKVIVICPASMRTVWRYEFDRWSILEPDVIIRSYSELVMSRDKLAELWSYNPDVLILDEAHRLKNSSAKRTRMVYGAMMKGGLAKRVRSGRIWLLSGTPMPNHPGELWSHLVALRGESRTYEAFTKHYCNWRPSVYGPGWTPVSVKKAHRAELRSHFEGWVLGRKADDVLDLPEIRWADLPVAVDPDDRGHFGKKLENLRRILTEEGKDEAKLLQALAMYGEDAMATYHRHVGLLKAPAICEYIKEEGIRKVLVFCHHRDVYELFREHFGIRSTGIVGGMSDKDKASTVDKFQNDPECQVFVGSIKAAGEGLTLTQASRVIFAESTWSPGDMAQAAKRAHRIGQSRAVLVQTAFVPGSVDDLIHQVVTRKAEMISGVMD